MDLAEYKDKCVEVFLKGESKDINRVMGTLVDYDEKEIELENVYRYVPSLLFKGYRSEYGRCILKRDDMRVIFLR